MTRRATASRTDTSASRLQHGTTVLSRSPASESGVPSTRRARSPRRRPKMQVRAGSPRTHVWMSAGHPVRTAQRHPGDERPAGELEAHRAVRHLHLGRGRHRNALVAHALREPLGGGAGRAIRRERGEIVGGRPVERRRRARRADPDRQPLAGVDPHFHDGVGGERRERHTRPLPADRLGPLVQLVGLRSVDHDAPVGQKGRDGVAENLGPGPQLGLERRRIRGQRRADAARPRQRGGKPQPPHTSRPSWTASTRSQRADTRASWVAMTTVRSARSRARRTPAPSHAPRGGGPDPSARAARGRGPPAARSAAPNARPSRAWPPR